MISNTNNSSNIVSKSLALTIFISFTLWLVILLNFTQEKDNAAKYLSLIDASMETRLEVAYAHLWFEEIMSGDQNESLDEVMKHIDNALWYANAMLKDGVNEKGEYHALTDENLIQDIEHVIAKLEEFERLTIERHDNLSESFAGSDIDQKYDDIFKSLIAIAEEVEVTLHHTVIEESEKMASTHLIMAVIVLIVTFGMALKIRLDEKAGLREIKSENKRADSADVMQHTDPLTGLANRKAFDEKLDAEFSRSMKKNTPVSLILVEVDGFNEYKSHYGKNQTDQLLIDVAEILQSICNSPTELVAHFGVHYFVVMPTGAAHSRRIANALCQAVEYAHIENEVASKDKIVTISLGLVQMNPQEGILLPEELLKNADNALLLAKQAGGNQVIEFDN